MWRPKEWKGIKPRSTLNPDDPELKRDRVLTYTFGYEWGVEDGADAMLKALIDHLLSYPDDAIPNELRGIKEE